MPIYMHTNVKTRQLIRKLDPFHREFRPILDPFLLMNYKRILSMTCTSHSHSDLAIAIAVALALAIALDIARARVYRKYFRHHSGMSENAKSVASCVPTTCFSQSRPSMPPPPVPPTSVRQLYPKPCTPAVTIMKRHSFLSDFPMFVPSLSW